MAPVLRELRRRSGEFDPKFCFSGQHRELAMPFLRDFDLSPDMSLELMVPGQSLGQLTARASEQLDRLFSGAEGGFDTVLVQGDTTTAFVAGLVAFYHRIPVGHVEAGLRTDSIDEPFPEELNRRLITRIAKWHYAPTTVSAAALRSENVPEASILVTGNTGIDSLLWMAERAPDLGDPGLRAFCGESKSVALVTVHRRENLGEPVKRILSAVRDLAREFPDTRFVWPVHLNPGVRTEVRSALGGESNVWLGEPLGYRDLVSVMKRAALILSDSGGIQEEAPALLKPVLVLRNETERPEAVTFGTSILVGSDPLQIVEQGRGFLSGKRCLEIPASATPPYGDGHAAERIAEHLAGVL